MAKKNVLTRAKKQKAVALLQLGNPAEARPLLEQVCRIDRSDIEAQFMLGTANGMLGEHGKAEQAFRQMLLLSPHHPDANNNLGLSLEAQGQSGEAIQYFEKAVQRVPDNADFVFNYANALETLGKLKLAREQYENAISLKPNYPDAYCNLGNVLQAEGDYSQAVDAFEKAISLSPDFARQYPQVYINLGNALTDVGRDEAALQAYQRAVALQSDNAGVYLALGSAYLQHGDWQAAAEAFRYVISLNPVSGSAYRNLVQTRRYTERDSDVDSMESIIMREEVDNQDKTELAFALGKVYGDLKDDARSFDYYLQGNMLKRQGLDYHIEQDREFFALIKQIITPEFLQRHAGVGIDETAPIFIVGMPRSGTSLTEQILASHSQVYGAGELNDLRIVTEQACEKHADKYPTGLRQSNDSGLSQIAVNYLERLHAYAPAARRITDKMPHNFLYVGLIHLLLPNARIIHCQRNPMDNALSIFKMHFTSGVSSHPYAYNLTELGQYYCLYQELMDYWRQLIPDSFYELRYEDLVLDQEAQTRRLLDYCELPWQDTCLTFHRTERVVRTASLAQVRQPIHAGSVEGWRRFESQLEPFARALEQG